MEKVEAASRLVLEALAAFQRRDWSAISALCCPDVLMDTATPAPTGTLLQGVSSVIGYGQDLLRRFPALRVEVTEVMSFGHRGVARFRLEDDTQGVMLLETRDGRLARVSVFVKRSETPGSTAT